MGVQIRNVYLYTLSFADDQAEIWHDEEDLIFVVRKLENEYTRIE